MPRVASMVTIAWLFVPSLVMASPARTPAPLEAVPEGGEAVPEGGEAVPAPLDPQWKADLLAAADHFAEGKALMSEGRYSEAAAEFERSFARVELGGTLFRMAEAYDSANEPVRALYKARQYLALEGCDGGRESTANNYPCGETKRRMDMVGRAERLRKRSGELKLQLAEGVELREVRVADRVVPLSEFPLLVSPGSFTVHIVGPKQGQVRSYDVTLEGGGMYSVFVPPFLVAPKPDDVVEDPREDIESRLIREHRRRITRGFFWGGVGLTVVSGGVVGILGGLTLRGKRQFERIQSDFNNGLDPPDDPLTPGVSYPATPRRDFDTYQSPTNTMIAVTAALGVATVVVGIFAFSKQSNGANARLRVDAGGLALRW